MKISIATDGCSWYAWVKEFEEGELWEGIYDRIADFPDELIPRYKDYLKEHNFWQNYLFDLEKKSPTREQLKLASSN